MPCAGSSVATGPSLAWPPIRGSETFAAIRFHIDNEATLEGGAVFRARGQPLFP